MNHLTNQISIDYNKHHGLAPMFDTKVDLMDNEVAFNLPISSSPRENDIRDIIFRIFEHFISIASLVPQLDQNPGDYLIKVKDEVF